MGHINDYLIFTLSESRISAVYSLQFLRQSTYYFGKYDMLSHSRHYSRDRAKK